MQAVDRFVREKPHGESGGVAHVTGCHGHMPSDEQNGAHCSALVALPLRLKISSSLGAAHFESVHLQCSQQGSVRFVVEIPHGASGSVGHSDGAHDQMPSVAHLSAQRTAPEMSVLPSGAPATDIVHSASVQSQSCQHAVVRFVVEKPQGAGGAVGLGMAELVDEELEVVVVVQFLGRVGHMPTWVHSDVHCVVFSAPATQLTSSAASGLHCDWQ